MVLFSIMTVMGAFALFGGEIKLTRRRVVVGDPARWIGVILLAPLPLSLTVFFGLADAVGQQSQAPEPHLPFWMPGIIELVIFVACAAAATVIAVMTAGHPEQPPARGTPIKDGKRAYCPRCNRIVGADAANRCSGCGGEVIAARRSYR